ncbi:MAG: hypothetical protein AAGI66_09820 [Cyanobacteria bacterium P01_H01_bin.74]
MTRDRLETLYDETILLLLEKVKDKTATAADLSVIRQFLKDNNITSLPTKDNALGNLCLNLQPLSLEDVVEDYQHQ